MQEWQQHSLRNSVGRWKELWTRILGCASGSHHQMPEEPKQAAPPFGASVFLFACEVFGFLVPESLPALTFDSTPMAN